MDKPIYAILRVSGDQEFVMDTVVGSLEAAKSSVAGFKQYDRIIAQAQGRTPNTCREYRIARLMEVPE